MATNKRTIQEKIEIFKIQCRRLEQNAEILVSEDYDIEPVIKIYSYGSNCG